MGAIIGLNGCSWRLFKLLTSSSRSEDSLLNTGSICVKLAIDGRNIFSIDGECIKNFVSIVREDSNFKESSNFKDSRSIDSNFTSESIDSSKLIFSIGSEV